MKNWIIVIMGLIIALFIWLQYREPEPDTVQPHQDSIQVIRQTIDSLMIRQYQLQEELKIDSAEKANEIHKRDVIIAGLKSKIRSISLVKASQAELDSSRIAIYGPSDNDTSYCMPIDHARQSIADGLKSRLQDSLLNVQVEKISLLESDRDNAYLKFNERIKNLNEQLALKDNVNQHFEAIAGIYQDQAKKEKKKGRVLKVLVPVAFIGGILIGK